MRKTGNAGTVYRGWIAVVLSVLVAVMAGLLVPHTVRAAEAVKQAGKTTVKMMQFDTKKLQLSNAESADIKWSSSNTNICVVDQNGTVQAVGGGKCSVVAAYNNNNYTWKIEVTPLKLNNTNLRLLRHREGAQLKLNSKSAQKIATWTSTNSAVASVSGGYVTPHAAGSAVINVQVNQITLSCNVQVLDVSVSSIRKVYRPKNSANRGKVVLAGGAIFDHWANYYSAFGSTDVLNNAIVASTIGNWLKWSKKLITDYKPKAVVLCLGAADIGDGTLANADVLAGNMQKLIEKIHKKSKKTKIFFCSQPMFPYRTLAWDVTNNYNAKMKAYCKTKKYVTYLGLNEKLMKQGGAGNPALFKEDHTYFSASGYEVLRQTVVKKVRKAAK